MNSFDFDFIVLPLGILVVALVAAIILISQKDEIANKRKTKRRCLFQRKSETATTLRQRVS